MNKRTKHIMKTSYPDVRSYCFLYFFIRFIRYKQKGAHCVFNLRSTVNDVFENQNDFSGIGFARSVSGAILNVKMTPLPPPSSLSKKLKQTIAIYVLRCGLYDDQGNFNSIVKTRNVFVCRVLRTENKTNDYKRDTKASVGERSCRRTSWPTKTCKIILYAPEKQ